MLYMTPSPGPVVGDTRRALDVNVPPHSYRYEICLPDQAAESSRCPCVLAVHALH